MSPYRGRSTNPRHVFETTLPAYLEAHGASGGFRCRFHVAGTGAWEVNMRLMRACCVDAVDAPGGYHAVVELSANDWGTDLKELASAKRLKVSLTLEGLPEDRERAIELLDVLQRGPPYSFPVSLRRTPVGAAFFRGTHAEVRRMLSAGWLPRLDSPRRLEVYNPFTKRSEPRDTYEPIVTHHPTAPSIPLQPFVEMPFATGGDGSWT